MEEQLDCRGILCPLSLVKISKKIKTIRPGEIVQAIGDDLSFPENIRAWCRKMGHDLVSLDQEEAWVRAVIRKG